jgi:hypothetical protein
VRRPGTQPSATSATRGIVITTRSLVHSHACGRWRKKWEDCWDEVTTCSKRCNSERKKANRIAKGAAAAEDAGLSDSSHESGDESANGTGDDAKANRKAAKKAAKLERRARREGTSMSGQKACDMCERSVDLLIRCQLTSGRDWSLCVSALRTLVVRDRIGLAWLTVCTCAHRVWHSVCGRCWKTPAVAGGVVDGSGDNPHYRYGGLWKNHHRATA